MNASAPAPTQEWIVTYDGDGRELGRRRHEDGNTSVPDPALVKEVREASLSLIKKILDDAKTTSNRLRSSFQSFLIMLWATFALGILSFAAAVVAGFNAHTTGGVVVTAIFGGLSASTFVATFIARPTGAMGDAGPRAAWVQAIVTTFWTKFGYMDDPDTVLQQVQDAQDHLVAAMKDYFALTQSKPVDDTPDPSPSDVSVRVQ